MPLRIGRLLVLVGLAVALGLLWNAFSGRGFPLSANAFLKEGDEVVDAPEAKRRLEAGALFLDARPVDFYNMSHIPGSRPLPENDFDRFFSPLEGRLRSTFDIVIYCSGYGCEASHQVARRLREKGIQAAILNEGWPAWTEAGYPVKDGPEP